MRRLSILVAAVAVLVAPNPSRTAPDAVSVETSVEPSVAAVGETVTYRLEVRLEGRQSIQIDGRPDFGDAFRVVGHSNSPRLVMRGGQIRRTRVLSYRLRALRSGSHTIDPPTVQVGGRAYGADGQTVRVVESGSGAPPSGGRGGGRRSGTSDDSDTPVRLRAELEPDRRPYLGEQLMLTYHLLSDPHRRSIDPRERDAPTLDRFWIEDRSRKVAGQSSMTNVDGRYMRKSILRSYVLFPLETGTITIEPMKVDVELGGILPGGRVVEVASDPLELEVRPLPSGAPPSFYEGNVGDWSFHVRTDSHTAKRGGTVTLRLIADGSGNLGRLRLPSLEGVEGFEVADRDEEIDKTLDERGVHGRKVVTCTLVPKRNGELTLPALEFSYFDPESETYRTETADPLTFEIRGSVPGDTGTGRTEKSGTNSSDDEEKSRRDRLIERLAGPLRERSSADGRPEPAESLAFAVAAAIPVLGLLLLLVAPLFSKRFRDLQTRRDERALVRRIRNRFEEAADAPGQTDPEVIFEGWKLYGTELLDLPGGRTQSGSVVEPLEERGFDRELAEEVSTILEWCESVRFSPASEIDAASLRRMADRSKRALDALENERDARGDGGTTPPGTTGVAIALAAGIALGAPASSRADGEADASDATGFDRALELHEAGNWERAADEWRSLPVWSEGPTPAVQYNLGTALAHLGLIGEARLQLERAALRAPGRPEIRTNLEVVRELVGLQRRQRGAPTRDPDELEANLTAWKWAAAIPVRHLWAAGVLALWLALFGLAGRRFLRSSSYRRAATAALLVGLSGATLAAGTWYWKSATISSVDPYVLREGDATVRAGPSEHAPVVRPEAPLVPGTMIRKRSSREGWIRIALPGASDGLWLRRSDVEPLRRE